MTTDRGIDPSDLTSDNHLLRRWWVWLHADGLENDYLVGVFWDRADAERLAANGDHLVVRENLSAPHYN